MGNEGPTSSSLCVVMETAQTAIYRFYHFESLTLGLHQEWSLWTCIHCRYRASYTQWSPQSPVHISDDHNNSSTFSETWRMFTFWVILNSLFIYVLDWIVYILKYSLTSQALHNEEGWKTTKKKEAWVRRWAQLYEQTNKQNEPRKLGEKWNW